MIARCPVTLRVVTREARDADDLAVLSFGERVVRRRRDEIAPARAGRGDHARDDVNNTVLRRRQSLHFTERRRRKRNTVHDNNVGVARGNTSYLSRRRKDATVVQTDLMRREVHNLHGNRPSMWGWKFSARSDSNEPVAETFVLR